ncbi:D-alanine--D-alanine ligase [Microbulbifer flavimaris]|uniref:D-alanine--D-alanine ligase n=1 Tax=Microbulbifer flavimaris TaxID=1781068 RepID=A0ABX4I0M6_9GAMM|nr:MULTISPECIES: D-alanine--D-alanine ligase [Microbulbifer]KUJ83516.1 D-alanine--D-alanine ligase [Microbulbifer sp. ZGT114]PCO05676.1 D-alanine--D-alanine ligase [Microbulbifer flavimaris]
MSQLNPIQTLLICGGGSSEHDVSLRTADFIEQQLQGFDDIHITRVEMDANGRLTDTSGGVHYLSQQRQLVAEDGSTRDVHYVIPAIHGYPGETGDLQSQLELFRIPYFGCGPEASKLCFNKITTKLWLSALGIDNTPYQFLFSNNGEEAAKATMALQEWGAVFVKASNQGSSVGCFKVTDEKEMAEALEQAFALSPYVLVEKCLKVRELEVAAYSYEGELVITPPGEVCAPEDTFYSYEEKYAEASRAKTFVEAEGLSEAQLGWIHEASRRAFMGLQLKDLSRIDFFLTDEGDIYLNEVNTFPGMTPISMFPKMLANAGHDFSRYLSNLIRAAVAA